MKSAYQFNIEKMQTVKPSMAYKGENFLSWQKEARAKLSELIGLHTFSKCAPELEIEFEKKIEGATEIRFTYQSEEGYRVPCHLLLPDGVENPPVIICLQGHSTGMHISLGNPIYPNDAATISGGDRDFCVRAVKEGYAAIAMEQRNFGECGGKPGATDCMYSAVTCMLFGRTTAGERVWDIMRLIDLLESDFADKVDVKNICLMGNSGGGTATAYTAALEDRIVLAMPSCAMCTYKDSIGAMPHCHCNFVPHIAEYFDMGDLLAMSYPKYYIQVNGLQDNIFPIKGAEEVFEQGKSAYREMGAEDKLAHVKGPEGHRFYADLSWPIVHKFLK